MPEGQARLSVTQKDGVNVVEFSDRKILEELSIREIEEELFGLVQAADAIKLLLNFKNVEHLSSAALGMLINLEKQVARKEGKLMLSDINPQIFEVFKITRLHKMFEIHDTAAEAMKHF
ncbi:MAG: STAS domain-containing protein [Planctomycetota bacterium]|jgi:anti-sigma B factor antagonist